jgi:redox-sensitive bicupin YhaK (pirin superfamily)
MDTHTLTAAVSVTSPRTVERLVQGQATSDGAGVRLTRVLTQDLQRRLDPFLMLDAFGTDKPGDYIGGFPDHPHRGFETVTYMLAGPHAPSRQRGQRRPAGARQRAVDDRRPRRHPQRNARAGRRRDGRLPALAEPARTATRCASPGTATSRPTRSPLWQGAGATVRVIAGASHGVQGAMQRESTEPLYLDVHLAAGACFEQALPATHNAFVYVYRGELDIGGTPVRRQRMAILANTAGSDGVVLQAGTDGADGARAIVIAGQPLGEPIAQYGPFVMNTQQEIIAAVDDFRAGKLA